MTRPERIDFRRPLNSPVHSDFGAVVYGMNMYIQRNIIQLQLLTR
jgi:hypothetical protein